MDVREARNTDSVFNNYSFAYKDMHKAEEIDKRARVAVVVSPQDNSHDFIETVSRNAGLDVVLFTDIDRAVAHLAR